MGINWLSWGLTTRQPLWVILCRLPEKGRKKIEEIVEEMKERNRNESEETEEIKTSPSTLTCYKDSKPCPAVSQYSWAPRWRKIKDTFAPPNHPQDGNKIIPTSGFIFFIFLQ